MGMLDFFKRKKKDDFSDLGDLDSGLDLGDLNKDLTGAPSDSLTPQGSQGNIFDTQNSNPFENQGSQSKDDYEMSGFQPPPAFNTKETQGQEKSNDLILAKLDSIRSEISNVHLRLEKIEEKLKTRRW